MTRGGGFSINQIRTGSQAGRWRVDIPASVLGKRKRYTFENQSEAKRFVRQFEAGLRAPEPSAVTARIDFGHACDEWTIDETLRVRRGGKRQVSLDTDVCRLKPMLRIWRDWDVRRIKGREIERYQAERLEAGISPASVNSEIRSLMKVLKWCLEADALDQLPKVEKCREQPTGPGELPTAEHVGQIIQAIDNAEDRLLVRFLAMTGVRKGEAFSLIWDDLDFDRQSVKIGFRRDFVPKTSTSNRIVYPGEIVMEGLRGQFAERRSERLVFPSKKDPSKQRVDIDKILATAARKVGLDMKVTPQVLRQFYATYQAENNVPEFHLQASLGHAPGSPVTRRYYTRVRDEVRREQQVVIPDV